MTRLLLSALLMTTGLLSLPAEARRLPGPTAYHGPNCAALYRATGQPVLYVGTVLGGQNRRGAAAMAPGATIPPIRAALSARRPARVSSCAIRPIIPSARDMPAARRSSSA